MLKKCEICGNEYEAKRETSRYCGDACRKRANRVSVTETEDFSVTNLSVTSVSVTKEPENVTDRVSVTCSSNHGDKYCSCGKRIYAVLHPLGPHEVLYMRSTMHLKITDAYIPENLRQGIDPGDCSCSFCATKSLKKQEVRA